MERSGLVQVGLVFRLRDEISKPKKKGKAPLFKWGVLNGENFEGNGLAPMPKQGFNYNGDLVSSSSWRRYPLMG